MTDLLQSERSSLHYALSQELLGIYNEFVELQETYAVLYDGVTTVLSTQAKCDPATLEVINNCSKHMQQRADELKGNLQNMQERYGRYGRLNG